MQNKKNTNNRIGLQKPNVKKANYAFCLKMYKLNSSTRVVIVISEYVFFYSLRHNSLIFINTKFDNWQIFVFVADSANIIDD